MNSGMRLIVYTGKGGTGKTVISCSTAIKLADRNYRTLVISSDPAHTLSDAFIQQISDDTSDVIEVFPNLYALQVDPIIEINRQYGEILTYTASIFSSKGVDETLAYEIAMMPGMTQLFSLLKIEEVIRSKLYDVVVLDMPASGEALRYLYFPKLVGGINRKLMGLIGAFSGFQKIFQAFSGFSLPDKMLRYEQELFERLDYLSNIISDNEVTTMRLVANPDKFSIENAKRALVSANLYGINVDLAVINKIMPILSVGKDSTDYYTNWTKFQHKRLDEAKANFYPLPIKEVPLHSNELAGVDMLRANADLLFPGGEDPAKIFYHGKPFSIIKEDPNKLRLAVKVPFVTGENFEIKRSGSDIIVKIRTPTGYLSNVIPLPTITFNMKLLEAYLDNNVLNIIFEKLKI